MSSGSRVPATFSSSETTQRQRKHIFAVNDSGELLELLRQLFQDEYYNVTTTNYLELTIEQIAASPPALLLVDLVAGKRGGWHLLEQLRERAATVGIPVIITSTDFRLIEDVQHEKKRFGGNEHFIMPFDLDELMTSVSLLIGDA